jgi:hypothetical protein
MNPDEKTKPAGSEAGAAGEAPAKKPYIKPAFVRERAFETMALSCGKINITQAQCKFNRKSS